jgi:hypothetical protein
MAFIMTPKAITAIQISVSAFIRFLADKHLVGGGRLGGEQWEHGPQTGRMCGVILAVEEPDGQIPLWRSTIGGKVISELY